MTTRTRWLGDMTFLVGLEFALCFRVVVLSMVLGGKQKCFYIADANRLIFSSILPFHL